MTCRTRPVCTRCSTTLVDKVTPNLRKTWRGHATQAKLYGTKGPLGEIIGVTAQNQLSEGRSLLLATWEVNLSRPRAPSSKNLRKATPPPSTSKGQPMDAAQRQMIRNLLCEGDVRRYMHRYKRSTLLYSVYKSSELRFLVWKIRNPVSNTGAT